MSRMRLPGHAHHPFLPVAPILHGNGKRMLGAYVAYRATTLLAREAGSQRFRRRAVQCCNSCKRSAHNLSYDISKRLNSLWHSKPKACRSTYLHIFLYVVCVSHSALIMPHVHSVLSAACQHAANALCCSSHASRFLWNSCNYVQIVLSKPCLQLS